MVLGANPCENHPIVWQYINEARKANAKLIVADPRRTRTAAQADTHLRMRPGTNGAFIMGIINYLIQNNLYDAAYQTVMTNRVFTSPSGHRFDRTVPKWTDALFKLNVDRTDYQRTSVSVAALTTIKTASSAGALFVEVNSRANFSLGDSITIGTALGTEETRTITGATTDSSVTPTVIKLSWSGGLTNAHSVGEAVTRTSNATLADIPVVAADLNDPDCVFQVLKARAAHYTSALVADICDIPGGATAFEAFAAMIGSSHGDSSGGNIYGTGPAAGANFPGTILYAMGGTQYSHASQILRGYSMLQMLLGNMGRAGGGVNALRGIHNVQGSTDMGVLYSSVPGYSDVPLRNESTLVAALPIGATSAQIWYHGVMASGDTVRLSAGKGSSLHEDVVLTGDPSGSEAPFTITFAATSRTHAKGAVVLDITTPVDPDLYGKYMDKLYGGARTTSTTTHWNRTRTEDGWNLQQHGFRNMMWHYFRKGAYPTAADADILTGAPAVISNTNFDLMPKGNGLHHIQMFQRAAATYTGPDKIKLMYVFGQNPAVTEPNLPMVRTGLYDLETLVVMDMWETETAGVPRNATGVTYLLPSAAFVEEEGSITNSGRWIQWRYKAANPQGNSKSDTEILLTLAKKLDDAGAFDHINAIGASYAPLYGNQYGWTPGTNYNTGAALPGNNAATIAENIFKQMAHGYINKDDTGSTTGASGGWGGLWIYRGAYGGWAKNWRGRAATTLNGAVAAGATSITLTANATVADETIDSSNLISLPNYNVGNTFYLEQGTSNEEMCTISAISGTGNVTLTLSKPLAKAHANGVAVAHVFNRAKSRGNVDVGENGQASGKGIYSNWGWAWLKNRRVFYNNASVAGDVTDGFVAPDSVGRFFVHTPTKGTSDMLNVNVAYSATYRYYSALSDKEAGDGSVYTATKGATMPKHWEPHETPREDLRTKYGVTGDVPTGSVGAVASYPLTLTTIRVTEHFQGGPTTRNLPWLSELVADPFIEINSEDALALGIVTGDNVHIDTVRATGIGHFKAIVGTGPSSQQRVKKGVVAIPWHWGNKGIVTGPSANDLTIDALDTNIKMPEFKACLCRIYK